MATWRCRKGHEWESDKPLGRGSNICPEPGCGEFLFEVKPEPQQGGNQTTAAKPTGAKPSQSGPPKTTSERPDPSTSSTKPSVKPSSQPSPPKATPKQPDPSVTSTNPSVKPPSQSGPPKTTSTQIDPSATSTKPSVTPPSQSSPPKTVTTPSNSGPTAPVAGHKRSGLGKRREANEKLAADLAAIEKADPQQKKKFADAAAGEVAKLLEGGQLADHPPAECAVLIAKLISVAETKPGKTPKSPNEYTIPPEQKKALAQLYSVMKLDADFEADDGPRRNQVLSALKQDPKAKEMSEGWGKTYKSLSEADLRTLQAAQVKALAPSMLDNPDDILQFSDEATIGESAGVCRGKKVLINRDKLTTFGETLDTTVHETTHAYQKHLTGQLKSGAITADDPRFAQAQLFKLNSDAGYFKAPKKPGPSASQDERNDYNTQYAAYQNQPTERHAWQAGGEAGRLFDVDAANFKLADSTALIKQFVEAGGRLDEIAKELQGTPQQASTAVPKLEAIMKEAVYAADKKVSTLLETPGLSDYLNSRFVKPGEWHVLSKQCQSYFTQAATDPQPALVGIAKLLSTIEGYVSDKSSKGDKEAQLQAQAAQLVKDISPLFSTPGLSQYLDKTYTEKGLWQKYAKQFATHQNGIASNPAGACQNLTSLKQTLADFVKEMNDLEKAV